MQEVLLTYNRIKGFDFEKGKLFDGFQSLIIYENYGKCDTFELDLKYSLENIILFQPDNVFKFQKVFYYIDDVSASSDSIKVCGQSLAGKYDSRNIDRIYTANKSPALIAYDHFNQEMISPPDYSDALGTYKGSNRKINYLTLVKNDGLGLANIDYQTSYGSVQEAVETLCQTYDFGFKETAVKGTVSNQIQIFKGRDVSRWVIFSDDSDGYENLTDVEFEHSTFDEKTSAHVFGEGEGADRVKVIVNPNFTGLERKEIYVDARDIQSTDQTTGSKIPTTTYQNMLKDRGNQKLAEQSEIITLNGDFVLESKLVRFGKDFFVGDRVTLKSKRYEASKVATITQAKRTFNEKGEYVELSYDKETPTIYQVQGRK